MSTRGRFVPRRSGRKSRNDCGRLELRLLGYDDMEKLEEGARTAGCKSISDYVRFRCGLARRVRKRK